MRGVVIGLGAAALFASVMMVPVSAVAQPRHATVGPPDGPRYRRAQDRRDERGRERERFERREIERRPVPWHLERGHGWRFERGPGAWSPYYAWWWVDQQVVLMTAPSVTVVQYPTGRYELRGDGAAVPFYWVWVPAQAVVAAPVPPPLGAHAPPDVVVPGPPPPPPAR